MKEIGLINKSIGRFLLRIGNFQFKVVILSDNPKHEDIESDTIYVVGGKDYEKWAYMKCPDNCGENIILNLSPRKRPFWRLHQDKIGRISIYPSVHKLDGCKSHFWITKGRLLMVNDYFY